jgi:NADH-quinone oxidoreductase subunit M
MDGALVVNQSHLLTVLTFFPLLGTFALLLLKGDDHVWIRRLALVTSVIEFILSLLLLRSFDLGIGGYQTATEEVYSWIPSLQIHYHLGIDGISLFLVLLTTFLTPLAVLCSWNSIHDHVKEFFAMLLVLEMGMVGVFCSLDLFLFFLFWEVMLIPMYFLIGVWGHGRKVYAALKFILYTMLGSILMLVAILWLYHLSGTFDLVAIQSMLSSNPPGLTLSWNTELLLFLAFMLAFAIKVPLFPLHTWLPDAHTEAPTAGSVILAGVLLKMGTYGMLRFCLPLFPAAAHRCAPVIAVLAIIGIVYAALVAMVQHDLKRLVAYTSVSHLGFVVLGIFVFNPTAMEGAVYQMLNHGVSTGVLFLVCGMLYDRRHTYEIKEYGGLAKPMPILCAFFLFACLSSLALPMLNGFVGEFMILIGVFDSQHFAWASWAATGAILSAVYLLWAYQRVALEKVTVEKNNSLPDASARERLILIVASVVILFMGIFSPMFTHRMDATTNALLEQMRTTASYQVRARQPQTASRASATKPTAHEVALHSVSLERQARP